MPSQLEGLMGKAVPRGLALTPYSFQIGWETLSVLRVGEGEFDTGFGDGVMLCDLSVGWCCAEVQKA